MSGRGTTAVAWLIGLGALVGQAVAVGTASMLQAQDGAPATIEAPEIQPATGPEHPEGHDSIILVVARVG